MEVVIGDRSRATAQQLWNSSAVRSQLHRFLGSVFDNFSTSPASSRRTGKTNHIERFNCTLRWYAELVEAQRVSRLVRKTLSFSKKLSHHIGAIGYFIHHYNATILT